MHEPPPDGLLEVAGTVKVRIFLKEPEAPLNGGGCSVPQLIDRLLDVVPST